MADGTGIGGRDLRDMLGTGDAMIIVPPYAQIHYAHLGAHVLQACARAAGFDVRVLYANIIWASLIGVERYQLFTVHSGVLLGERSFARAAFETEPWGRNASRIFGELGDPDSTDDQTRAWARTISDALLDLADGSGARGAVLAGLSDIECQAPSWADGIAQTVADLSYPVVGATTSVEQMAGSIALLKRIKTLAPNGLAILGGANCDGPMADAVATLDASIDYVFSGECDVLFPKFLTQVFAEELPQQKILRGPPITQMDGLPRPRFDEFFEQYDHFLTRPGLAAKPQSMPFETSRGCWWGQKHHCTFCGINGSGMGFRERSPEGALEDMRQLRADHGNLRFIMADAIMPWSYRKTLLPRLAAEDPPFKLAYEEKANLGLKDLMLLRDAGVDWITAGIEALSSDLLRRMKKGVLGRQNIAVLRYGRLCNVTVSWTLLLGFPGDRIEDYEMTLELIPLLHHLQPPSGVFPIMPTRFSPYFNDPEAHGITNLRPQKGYADIFPAHVDLAKLAYNFEGDYETCYHSHPELRGQIERAVSAWKQAWSHGHRSNAILRATPMGADLVMIRDTRRLDGTEEYNVLPRRDAACVLTQSRHDPQSELQAWAIDRHLGVHLDGCYVPLATASPEFLLALEGEGRAERGAEPQLVAAK